jgi:hypothetical protein
MMKFYLTFSTVTFYRYCFNCCTLQLHKPLCPFALSGIFCHNYGAFIQAIFWFWIAGFSHTSCCNCCNILPCYTITILNMNETEHGGSCSWSLGAGVWLGVLFGGSGHVMKKNVRRKAVKPGHLVSVCLCGCSCVGVRNIFMASGLCRHVSLGSSFLKVPVCLVILQCYLLIYL